MKYQLIPLHELSSNIFKEVINLEGMSYIFKNNNYIDIDKNFKIVFNHYLKDYIEKIKLDNIIIINTCEIYDNWCFQSLSNVKYLYTSRIPLYLTDSSIIFNSFTYWNILQKSIKKYNKQIKIISNLNISSKDIIRYLSSHIGETFIEIIKTPDCLFGDSNYSFPDITLPKYLIHQLDIQCRRLKI